MSENLLLRRMAAADRRALIAAGETVPCPRGSVLIAADAMLDAVYFPISAVCSIEERLAHRAGIGVAVVGREGFVGWPVLLGAARAGHAVAVRGTDGAALRIERAALLDACRRSEALYQLLLRFVHVMIAQIGRTIASQIEHPLDRRIAGWILMRHDRLDDDDIAVRHDEIGDALNSRRASVTDALHRLEGDHLVRCKRERVSVRDRAGLEAFAGEAYGASEELYRRLIGPFGKGQGGGPHHLAPVAPALAGSA